MADLVAAPGQRSSGKLSCMTIALLGTGLLGSAIATRLLACGHSLSVWNRDPERCRPLVALGAQMVAAISSVYSADNHRSAASAFAELFR